MYFYASFSATGSVNGGCRAVGRGPGPTSGVFLATEKRLTGSGAGGYEIFFIGLSTYRFIVPVAKPP
jgi:hypothetical protein